MFVPSGIYQCADGHVAIVAGTDAEFRGLAEALGRPDLVTDPRFETAESRRHTAHADALDAVIQAWCAAHARSDIEATARRHGFAAAPVMSAKDQYEDPHFRARGSVEELDDRVYGSVVDYGPAPQLSATPARHKWAGRPVGWHNQHVLQGILGLPDEHVAELERRGIVGRWWTSASGVRGSVTWRRAGIATTRPSTSRRRRARRSSASSRLARTW